MLSRTLSAAAGRPIIVKIFRSWGEYTRRKTRGKRIVTKAGWRLALVDLSCRWRRWRSAIQHLKILRQHAEMLQVIKEVDLHAQKSTRTQLARTRKKLIAFVQRGRGGGAAGQAAMAWLRWRNFVLCCRHTAAAATSRLSIQLESVKASRARMRHQK